MSSFTDSVFSQWLTRSLRSFGSASYRLWCQVRDQDVNITDSNSWLGFRLSSSIRSRCGPCSVALVPADPLDVVPCCHEVAGMTVADFCVRLASYCGAHPFEVWRLMARRGTMALCAVG